ncbi:MAG TPA: hypothetical protein DIU49_13470, partial [Desulfovibrio sp.]|nr:hypothetical protein [Desulfovibrio sp.]
MDLFPPLAKCLWVPNPPWLYPNLRVKEHAAPSVFCSLNITRWCGRDCAYTGITVRHRERSQGEPMGHVEVARTLNAPVQAVWDCLNDIEHTPEWVTGLEAAEIKTSGPYGAGSVYHDHNRLGPFPQETPWYVTVFEPMTR